MMQIRLAAFSIFVFLGAATPSGAQGTIVPEAPYDGRLLRLAEVLGSIHFLTNLCGDVPSDTWRSRMNRIISLERPDPLRRARLIAAFNHGYRSFDSVYMTCTGQASMAARRYQAEGASISREIAVLFGR